jgi:dipeptidyl aminopeptidase/acylaminoacyl peptidase
MLSVIGLPRPIAAQTPSSDGPWVVYLSSAGNARGVTDKVIAINADGTGRTVLAEGEDRVYLQLATSKLGYVTFLAADLPADRRDYLNLTLTIMQLPSGKLIKELPLTNAKTATIPSNDRDPWPPQASITDVAPINVDNVEIASMSWSPDGKTLAFMGAEPGPSVDLYTYTPETDAVLRLTNGPTQSVRPVWSPDGKWIVHLGVWSLGTGAGYSVDKMWSAYADNSRPVIANYARPVLLGATSGDEVVLGWRNQNYVWVATSTADFGLSSIRAVNIGTDDFTVIWPAGETFRSAAADSQSGTVLITSTTRASSDEAQYASGLYLFNPDGDPQLKQLSTEAKLGKVVWSPASGSYYVENMATNQIIAVTPTGEITELPIPALPQVVKTNDATKLLWIANAELTASTQASDGTLGTPQAVATDVTEFVVLCPLCG